MLSIANDLRSHGYAYGPNSSQHTRIPGIWAKLGTIYDLEALDTREDEYSGWPDITGEDDDEDDIQDFSLSEEAYGENMWLKRFSHSAAVKRQQGSDASSSSRDSSPELVEGLNSVWDAERDRPAQLQALVDKAAAYTEEEPVGTRSKGKKTAASRSVSGRVRATRSTPVQETEEEEGEEEEEGDESTAAGSPPVSSKGQTKASRKKPPARKSTRKR